MRRIACWVGILAALVACSDAAGTGPAAAVAPAPDAPPAAEPEVWVDLDALTAPAPAIREIAADMDAGRWQKARAALAARLDEALPDVDAARFRLLLGICELRLGAHEGAARAFAAAAPHTPLADYARYQAARAHLAADQHEDAITQARQVAPDSEYAAAAQLVIGDALHAQKRWEALAEHDQRYLDAYPTGPRGDAVRFRLAATLERLGRAVPEAVAAYRNLTVRDGRGQWGKRARQRWKALLARAPRREARPHHSLAAADLVVRGMRLYDARRHARAAGVFEQAVSAATTTPEDLCTASYYLADSWFRHRDRTRAVPLFDEALTRCKETDLRDLQVKAAFQAGRSLAILGDWHSSRARFEVAETLAAAAGHSYADDARIFQAEAAVMLDQDDDARALLAAVPTRYPDGDRKAEALWRLAWMAYDEQDFAGARRWLERALATGTDRNDRARAQYWLARAHSGAGDDAAAVEAYVATARDYPLSYYALVALERLRAAEPARFEAAVQALRSEVLADPGALQLRPARIAADPAGARILELYRLGLRGDAERALIGRGRSRGDDQHAEVMWLGAALHHRAGDHPAAIWITRWQAIDYLDHWPAGAWRRKWDIAYPRPYAELIEGHAAELGYPTALQLAIVREESGFNPNIESRANAIGLTQMIRPTARQFGRPLGIRATARNLRNPRKNLAIGSRFLHWLWQYLDQRVALVPAGYNAGPGAVARWREQRGHLPMDAWIETIPSDETRRYTKRVLGSYFAYSYLADGTIPRLSLEAPGPP